MRCLLKRSLPGLQVKHDSFPYRLSVRTTFSLPKVRNVSLINCTFKFQAPTNSTGLCSMIIILHPYSLTLSHSLTLYQRPLEDSFTTGSFQIFSSSSRILRFAVTNANRTLKRKEKKKQQTFGFTRVLMWLFLLFTFPHSFNSLQWISSKFTAVESWRWRLRTLGAMKRQTDGARGKRSEGSCLFV